MVCSVSVVFLRTGPQKTFFYIYFIYFFSNFVSCIKLVRRSYDEVPTQFTNLRALIYKSCQIYVGRPTRAIWHCLILFEQFDFSNLSSRSSLGQFQNTRFSYKIITISIEIKINKLNVKKRWEKQGFSQTDQWKPQQEEQGFKYHHIKLWLNWSIKHINLSAYEGKTIGLIAHTVQNTSPDLHVIYS